MFYMYICLLGVNQRPMKSLQTGAHSGATSITHVTAVWESSRGWLCKGGCTSLSGADTETMHWFLMYYCLNSYLKTLKYPVVCFCEGWLCKCLGQNPISRSPVSHLLSVIALSFGIWLSAGWNSHIAAKLPLLSASVWASHCACAGWVHPQGALHRPCPQGSPSSLSPGEEGSYTGVWGAPYPAPPRVLRLP